MLKWLQTDRKAASKFAYQILKIIPFWKVGCLCVIKKTGQKVTDVSEKMRSKWLFHLKANYQKEVDKQVCGYKDGMLLLMEHYFSTRIARTKPLKVRFQVSNWCVDIIFLKGLYFEKIRDKSNMYGFSLYHDSVNFRKRTFFSKDE